MIRQPELKELVMEVIIPEQSPHGQHGPHTPHGANIEGCQVQQPSPSHFPGGQQPQHHLVFQPMPTYHSERTANSGRRNKWQIRPKYTGRPSQPLTATQSNNGYQQVQVVPFKTAHTTPSILMPLNEATPAPPLSTHTFIMPPPGFPPRPPHAQQNAALASLLQNSAKLPVTYCIVDGRTANPPGPCIYPVHTTINAQQPVYSYANTNFTPAVATNDAAHPLLPHRHCFQQGRQYSPQKFHQVGPPPGFTHKVYIAPRASPREHSPTTHLGDANGVEDRWHVAQGLMYNDDVNKTDINTRCQSHLNYDNLHNFSPITKHSVTCAKTSSISNNNFQRFAPDTAKSTLYSNGDLITSVASTSAHTLGNVQSTIVITVGSPSENQKLSSIHETLSSKRTASLPSINSEPPSQEEADQVSDENENKKEHARDDKQHDKNNDLLSVSSTSFDYTIEPEEMVSSICGTSPVKELDGTSDQQIKPNHDECYTDNAKEVTASKACKPISRPRLLKSTTYSECDNSDNRKSNALDNAKAVSTSHVIQSCGINDMNDNTGVVNNMDISQLNAGSTNVLNSSSRPIMRDLCTLAEKLCSKKLLTAGEAYTSESKETEHISVSCQVDLLETNIVGVPFRESLLRQCRDLAEILQTLPPSPHLDCIADFCSVIMNSDNHLHTHSNCDSQNDCLDDGLHKLILEFLHVALSWLHINFSVGGRCVIEVLSPELCERFQVWKTRSNTLLKCMLKGLLFLINLCVSENGNSWSATHVHDTSQLHPNQDPVEGSENVGNAYNVPVCKCPQSCTSSSTVSGAFLRNNVTNHSPLSYAVHRNIDNIINSDQVKDYVQNAQRNQRNWRQRRFLENQNETVASHEMNKQNSAFIKPLDLSMKVLNCSILSNGSCIPYCDAIFPADQQRVSVSKATREGVQLAPDRYSQHNINGRGRQRSVGSADKKSSPRGISTEANTLQRTQCPVHKRNTTTNFQVVTKTSTSQVPPEQQWLPEIHSNKTSLNPTDMNCPSIENQHHVHCGRTSLTTMESPSPISIQSFPESSSNVTYTNMTPSHQQNFLSNGPMNQLNPDTTIDSSGSTIQSKASHCKFSYQNSRSQLANKKKSNQPIQNNITSSFSIDNQSAMFFYFINQDDERHSSDESPDRVYYKPGSYPVPKKRFPTTKLRGSIHFRTNSASATRTLSPNDIPVASIARPPSRRLLQHTSWNAESTLSPPDFLQSTDSQEHGSSDSSVSIPETDRATPGRDQEQQLTPEDASREIEEITEENEVTNTIHQNDVQAYGEESVNGGTVSKEKERGCGDGPEDEDSNPSPTMGRRKCNAEKTDHWLMRILGFQVGSDKEKEHGNKDPVTTSNSTTETEDSSPRDSTDVEETSTDTPIPTLQDATVTAENEQSDPSSTTNGIIKSNSGDNTKHGEKEAVLKEGPRFDEVQQTPKNRKVLAGGGGGRGKKPNKMYQEAIRVITAPRKRKMQERSPNNDFDITSSAEATSERETLPTDIKPKEDIRNNKGMWSVWYSSRRRRGLSQLAVGKLEEILNCIWNMNEAEFVKYPVNSKTVADYHLIVKHPMFLQTIAYKLRNRIYETIEQFVHDFRRIFYNSRLYNPDTSVYSKMTDVLVEKFDFLLEDIFSGWDFNHITGNPNETTTIPSLQYIPYTNRGGNAKRRNKSKTMSTRSSTAAAATTSKDNASSMTNTQ